MAADIQSFLTGFLGARAAKMQREQDKTDEYEERLRNQNLRNELIGRNRMAMEQAARSMGDQLISWGATPDQIQAALKSSKDGLTSLYKTVSNVHSTLGEEEAKRFLGTVKADLGAIGGVGEDGLGDLYRQTFGLPTNTKVGDYKAPQESTLAKLFGATDRKARMLERLDEEMSGVGGYSVYDLSTIGTLPDYLPGSAGESISYLQPTIYSAANFAKEADFVDTRLKDLANNPDYKFAQEEYNAAAKKLASTKDAAGSDPYIAAQNRLEAARNKITAMQDMAIKQSVLTQASQYFNDEDYLKAIKGHIATAYGFVPSWFEEEEEAAKAVTEITNQSLDGALTGTPPASTAPEVTPQGLTVKRTINTPEGNKVQIAEVDGKEVVLSAAGTALPEAESQMVLDAINEEQPFDMPEAFVEGYNIPAKTMEERVAEKRESVGNVREAIVDGVVSVDEALADTFAGLDQAFVSNIMTANEKGNTFMGAAAQMIGADDAADFFYEQAIKSEDAAKDTEGLIPAINKVLDGLGVPDYSKEDKPIVDLQSAVDTVIDAIPAIPKEVGGKDLDEARLEAPDHIKKLGDQATDAWRRLTAEVKDFSFSDISLRTPDEDNPMLRLVESLITEEVTDEKPINVATRASDTPAYKQLQELLQERIALANKPAKVKKKKEEAIKKKAEKILIDLGDMSGAPGFRTEEVSLLNLILADELPERIVEPTYISYEEWDSMSKAERKAIKLDVSKTRIENMVREGRIPLPRGVELPDRLVEMRMASMPTPAESGELPNLPSNMAVESMLTRRERGPGLMRRPSAPELGDMPVPEEANKASALVDLRSVMARVHGKKSKAVKELDKIVQQSNRGIPIQYTDVNRLLRMTKSLRKSETRDKLIEQLAILANEARK